MPSIDSYGRTEREARLRRWCSYKGHAADPLRALAKSMEDGCSDPWETIWLAGSTVEEEMARWKVLRSNKEAAANGIKGARRVLDKYGKRLEFKFEWPSLEMPLPSQEEEAA